VGIRRRRQGKACLEKGCERVDLEADWDASSEGMDVLRRGAKDPAVDDSSTAVEKKKMKELFMWIRV
jgi:hypothetical protein